MTKKHFESIASDIRQEVDFARETERFEAVAALRVLANSLAATFQAMSPRFDRDVFLKACGF